MLVESLNINLGTALGGSVILIGIVISILKFFSAPFNKKFDLIELAQKERDKKQDERDKAINNKIDKIFEIVNALDTKVQVGFARSELGLKTINDSFEEHKKSDEVHFGQIHEDLQRRGRGRPRKQ